MAKNELPDNEELFSVDTPDIEDAEGGWDEWDDFDEAEDIDLDAEADVDAAEPVDDVDVDTAVIATPDDDDVAVLDAQVDTQGADTEGESADATEYEAAAEDTPAMPDANAVEEVPTLEQDWADEGDWGDEDDEAGWSDEEIDVDAEPDTELAPAQPEQATEDIDVAAMTESDEPEVDTSEADETDIDILTDDARLSQQQSESVEGEQTAEDAEIAAEAPAEDADQVAAEPESTLDARGDTDEAIAEDADAEVAAEAPKSEEEIAREQQELEAYRDAMGESTAELADVSEYRTFRKKTRTESTSSRPKKSEFDLFANRYKVKTMNAMVAASDPIVYFYNACLHSDGSIMAFNVYQVLQDRFLGKMIPQLFTAVAENSSKIEELNEANLLEQIKICAEFPQYHFIISISARFFIKPALLERLLKVIPEEGIPNLVLAFDCSSLENIAIAAKAGLSSVRQRGVKVLLDNTERVTMTVLSEFDYDFIRIDSRYYEIGNPRAEAYLRLILNLAKEQGVGTIASFCDSEDLSEYMFFMGVDAVQGNAVSRPMRTVPNSVKAITLLPSMLD